jgi:hypothetical protein
MAAKEAMVVKAATVAKEATVAAATVSREVAMVATKGATASKEADTVVTRVAMAVVHQTVADPPWEATPMRKRFSLET